jgi:hypothetical protein
MKRQACNCPSDGSYYCAWCTALAERAGVGLTPPLALLTTRPAEESEGAFMERLRKLAVEDRQLLFYHTYSSKRSTPGWPDTAIIHPEGGILHLWELKATGGTESGAQKRWRHALERVTRVDSAIYWPDDWPNIIKALQGR